MSLLTTVNNTACGFNSKTPNGIDYVYIDDSFTEDELIHLASVIYNAASDEQKKQITEIKK